MLRRALALLCCFVLGSAAASAAPGPDEPVRLAVVNSFGETISLRYFSETVDAIARADSPVRTLADLQGRSLAIVTRRAIAGWQVPAGQNPEAIFSSIREVGMPMDNVLREVKSGRADMGFLITCLLEELKESGRIARGEFRVIAEKKDPDFSCRHSNALYPGCFLSVKPTLPAADARRILKEVPALPPSPALGVY